MAGRIEQPGAGESPQCPRCEPGDRPLHPAEVPRAQGFPTMSPDRSWTPLPHSRLLTSGVSPHLWVRDMKNGRQLGKGENMEAQGESQLEVSGSPAWVLDFVWL